MKILLTNLFLKTYTGSESFLATLGEGLRARGHDVTFYVHHWGWFGDEMRFKGFECWCNPYFNLRLPILSGSYTLPHTNFDLIHFQHQETVQALYSQLRHLPKVYMSHGVLSKSERPLKYSTHPMEGYLGVSEETLSNCLAVAKIPDDRTPHALIRNIIDMDRFSAERAISGTLKSVVVISNSIHRTPHLLHVIQSACERAELRLKVVGKAGHPVKDTRQSIEDADLVVGIGRCALEGMAMGRNVLLFDYQGMEGLIDSEEAYQQFKVRNFSGRVRKYKTVTVEDVLNEFSKYSQANGQNSKNFIRRFHSTESVLPSVIKFYDSLISQPVLFQ